MWTSKGIVSIIFFSLFFVSCGHPFISIEVRTGGEIVSPSDNGDGPQGGCKPPWSACPGKYLGGEVVAIQKVDPLTFYRIKIGKEYRNFSVPPTVVEGTINKGDTVEINISNEGTMSIEKAK